MKIKYAKSFDRDIGSIGHNAEIRRRLLETIRELQAVGSPNDLPGMKKIEGYTNYYRARVGDYRLGIKLVGDTLELIRFLHRKDIYRRFP